jgi:nitroreductase
MTAAALLGIDVCPMEGFVPAQFDEILGLPDKARGSRRRSRWLSIHGRQIRQPSKVRYPAAELITHL